ncbi:MAG: cache domain-containing protein, partial [Desulfonatronovibrionaceae bacterium]
MRLSIKIKLAILALLPVLLFLALIMFYHVPAARDTVMEHKKSLTREMISAARGVLDYYHGLESRGLMDRERAQKAALEALGKMTYGPDGQDYFWVNDFKPRLLMHPMRPDLVGLDLSRVPNTEDFEFFDKFIQVVNEKGAGYVRYQWQYYDQEDRLEPKLSYVSQFEPWGWIVGTGVYVNDVWTKTEKIRAVSLSWTAVIILVVGGAALLVVISILRPLMKVVRFADQVSSGNLENRLEVQSKAEIASLVQSLNQMVSRLKAKIKEAEEKQREAASQAERAEKAMEERQQLQTQLIQAQKMESVGVLAGGVAHDFNNLLHAMGGNIHLLKQELSPDHPGLKKIEVIEKSISRAGKLVQQLLLFSRKAEVRKKPMDLNHEIREAAQVLKRTIPRMIEIRLDLDDQLDCINGDPVQIEQVILNLGSNAADAMPEGGVLLVETRNTVIEEDKYLGMQPGRYVLMSLSDTGIGMDKKTLEQIYDPFFTTKEVGQGTGLGLASVFGIIKSHQGNITCYSEKGQGTIFHIYLPALLQKSETKDQKPCSSNVQQGSETVLVVDDEDDIRELTSEALASMGYKIISAGSG